MVGFTNAGGSLEKLGIRIFTSKPANPKNGDIVVWTGTMPTTVEITPWKITADRSDSYDNGHVYIRLDTAAGAFGVSYGAWLKEKNPTIWLSSYWGPVLQKVSGKYQYMNAQIYFDGLWHKISSNWDGTLFYSGDQYTDYTGGWTVDNSNYGNGSIGNNILGASTGNTEKQGSRIYTNKAVNKGSYTTLHVYVTVGDSNSTLYIRSGGIAEGNTVAYKKLAVGNNAIPIPDGVTAFYPYLLTAAQSTCTVTKVWLE